MKQKPLLSRNKLQVDPNSSDQRQRAVHKEIYAELNFPAKVNPEYRRFISKKLNKFKKVPRVMSKDLRPMQRKNGLTKVLIYRGAIDSIEQNEIRRMEKHAKKNGFRSRKNSSIPQNPFRVGFAVLLPKNGKLVLSDANRVRWAKELHYAYLHGVKPENLLGFLYQEGPHQLLAKRYKDLLTRL